MSAPDSVAGSVTASGLRDPLSLALDYQPADCKCSADRLQVPAGGSHRIEARAIHAAGLFAAMATLRPEPGASLKVLGLSVAELAPTERKAMLAQTALLPATGGLISYLNAWENICLPCGFHRPTQLPLVAGQLLELLSGFGIEPRAMLAKMPVELTPFEKTAALWSRVILEAPALVLSEAAQTTHTDWSAMGESTKMFVAA